MGAKSGSLAEDYWQLARRARFLEKTAVVDKGCLEWQGGFLKGKGYGQFYWGLENGKMKNMQAHRAAWMLFKGPIQDGRLVLHKCNNRKCVNVKHLYIGTHEDNMRDRDLSGNTSKGAHRYNFVRTEELIQKVSGLRKAGLKIEEICQSLGIGRTTYYRIAAAGGIDAAMSREAARVNYRKAALDRDG